MSVLYQSGEEQVECPLCMEPLEVDDLNFFPCTCGYQICRFCWHRIRTDENGLCPACRKAYSENPADFTPLSKEQVAQLKAEKRQRDQQRKAKLSESRKHLASVRVVQSNLVFVVGLPMRLADPEILKKHEYFGKFGKIHKVVINQSSAYAGTQGPSASAYVTYLKSDDALRAIQSVNNTTLDGKTIKTSLGTTKYCSHFMKNQSCPKSDCMYLHDFGDQEASFTKEEMHAGKHQEYEKKLHEALLARQALPPSLCVSQSQSNHNQSTPASNSKTKELPASSSTPSTNGGSWPQLDAAKPSKTDAVVANNRVEKKGKKKIVDAKNRKLPADVLDTETKPKEECTNNNIDETLMQTQNLPEESERNASLMDDNASFFTQNTFSCAKLSPPLTSSDDEPILEGLIGRQSNGAQNPLLDVNDSERWSFDFGYTNHSNHLEELATQRGDERFASNFRALDTFLETSYGKNHMATTENLLESLVANSVTYQNIYGTQNKPFSNGHCDALAESANSSAEQPSANAFPNIFEFYRNMNGLQNGFHPTTTTTSFPQQQQRFNQLNLALMQQQQMEESLANLSLGKQRQPGMFRYEGMHNGAIATGFGAQVAAQKTPGPTIEDKVLEFHVKEAQKNLLEMLDGPTHNSGQHLGSNHVNVMRHSPGASHLPPPPPGFVQPAATHMNSFGSKILPYLTLNNQQQHQQQQQQINGAQSNWPNSFSQIQQQNQHKGIPFCNDWKVMDPAILRSAHRIPTMGPLIDQYAPQPQTVMSNLSGGLSVGQVQSQGQSQAPAGPQQVYAFSNYSNPIQPTFSNGFNTHALPQPNLNWLAGDLNNQISTPPGFRPTGQATKQQEC